MPHGSLSTENFVFDLITTFYELYYVGFVSGGRYLLVLVKVRSETSSARAGIGEIVDSEGF